MVEEKLHLGNVQTSLTLLSVCIFFVEEKLHLGNVQTSLTLLSVCIFFAQASLASSALDLHLLCIVIMDKWEGGLRSGILSR